MPFQHPEFFQNLKDDFGNVYPDEVILGNTQYNDFVDFFMQNQRVVQDSYILFHGGTKPVIFPSAYVNDPRKRRDFGDGFYTTNDVDQADRWALRKLDEEGSGAVSVYEYTQDLSGFVFPEKPNLDWLEFVVSCRSQKVRHDEYDIIEGPVADDNVGPTVNQYIAKQRTAEDTLRQLEYENESHQMIFTNEKATPHLLFLGWWWI